MNSIAFEAHPEQRAVLPRLAAHLRESFGIASHLYVGTDQDLQFYRRRGGDVFASVTVAPQLHAAATEGRHAAGDDETHRRDDQVLAAAAEIEGVTGLPLNHAIMANRHLGRGYALLGTNHPRSRESESVGAAETLRRTVHAVRFWKGEAERHGLQAVAGFAKTAAMGARYAGIPFVQLSMARFGNYFYWADDEFGGSRDIAARFAHLHKRGASSSLAMSAPYKAYTSVVQEYADALGLAKTVKSMARRVAQQVYWQLRGYAKARGYYLSEDLAYMARFRRDGRFLLGPSTKRLADLDGQRFVFFPLSTEPELSLSQLSPEFFFQHAAIAAVSRDLPAGVTLAVKDTFFALGRRPDEFYRTLLDLKNVVLLNVAEPGYEVVQKAAATVTINGSAGFEAAIMGRPVLAFGRHNIYNCLPHVVRSETLHDLRDPLRRILASDFDHAAAARDGSLLLQAIADTCIDGRDFDLTRRDDVPADFVADLAAALLKSIGGDSAGTAIRELQCAP